MSSQPSAASELLDHSLVDPWPDHTAAGVGERLIAVAHVSADWDVWGGPKAVRYWDALVENVAGCREESGGTLGGWWQAMCTEMSVGPPRRAADRALLARLLDHPDQTEVLDVLSTRTEELVLRVRVANDQRRATRQTNPTTTGGVGVDGGADETQEGLFPDD